MLLCMYMKNRQLHPIQKKILDLLLKNIDDPLTIRELREAVNASSTSLVAHHIKQLENKGYLKRNPSNPKDYQILKGAPERQITYLNLYGLAHCGPRGSILDGNPIDRVAVSAKLLSFPSSEGFMVRAKGDSMIPKINSGDLVIARKIDDVNSGSIAVCINDGETLIKKIQKEKGGNILISLNSEYPPFMASKDFRIEGEVKSVITYSLD